MLESIFEMPLFSCSREFTLIRFVFYFEGGKLYFGKFILQTKSFLIIRILEECLYRNEKNKQWNIACVLKYKRANLENWLICLLFIFLVKLPRVALQLYI